MNVFRPYRNHYLTFSFLSACLLLNISAFSQIIKEWDQTYGGSGWEELQTLILTDDGGYIFGGITTTDGPAPGTEVSEPERDTVEWPALTGDMWVIKTDSTGNILWDRRYGGFHQDRLWSIRQTPDGGYILGGESLSGIDIGTEHSEFNRGGLDYWLVKIDRDGNYQWDRTYGGPDNDIMRVVIPLGDGYMLFGYSNSNANLAGFGEKSEDSRGAEDFWIIRTDLNGNYLWDRTIGGDGQDWLNDAKQLPDGNFIISGWSTSTQGSGEKTSPFYGVNDYWIMKIDVGANVMWQLSLGGSGEDVPNDLMLTNDGSILVTGFSASPADGNKTVPAHGNKDAWIIKLHDEGVAASIEWQRSFGGQAADLAYSAAHTNLGNIMVAGVSSSEPDSSSNNKKQAPLIGGNDFWVIYLNPNGERQWDYSIGGLNVETCTKIIRAHQYGFIFGGHSSSEMYPPLKSDNSRGGNDIWIVRTGCDIESPGLDSIPFACEDELIRIDATVDSCIACDYFWDDGFSGPLRELIPDTSKDLKLTVVHPDGCEAKDSVHIEVVPGISGTTSQLYEITCYESNNGAFSLEGVTGGAPPYLFSMNGDEWSETTEYTSLSPGFYTLEVIDTNGCTYDTTFFLDQPEEVLVELGDDIDLELGDSAQLQALTNLTDSFYFEWGQPALLSCPDCMEPWVKPQYSTTYSIVVRDKNGCEATDLVRVIVDRESSVYIPNAFSPNNDNINDFFTIYTDASVREIRRLRIFDRWGELMFEREHFQPNAGQLGWDGRLNGRFMQPGVFAYQVEIEFIDGSTEIRWGDVTLVR